MQVCISASSGAQTPPSQELLPCPSNGKRFSLPTAGNSLISLSKHMGILQDFLGASAAGQGLEALLYEQGFDGDGKGEGRRTKAERKAKPPPRMPPTPSNPAVKVGRMFQF